MSAPRIKSAKEYGCPERLWLQHDPENTSEKFDEASEVTWCQHRIKDTDAEYVRVDLYDDAKRELTAALARVAELEKELAEARNYAASWKVAARAAEYSLATEGIGDEDAALILLEEAKRELPANPDAAIDSAIERGR